MIVGLGQDVGLFCDASSPRFFELTDGLFKTSGAIERGTKGVTPIKIGWRFIDVLLRAPNQRVEKGTIVFKSICQNTRP